MVKSNIGPSLLLLRILQGSLEPGAQQADLGYLSDVFRWFSGDVYMIYIYVLLVSYDVIATPLKNHGVKVSWDMLGWWFPIIIGKVIKFHGSSHHQPVSVIENHWNKAPVELFWHISSASLGPPLGSCLMTIKGCHQYWTTIYNWCGEQTLRPKSIIYDVVYSNLHQPTLVPILAQHSRCAKCGVSLGISSNTSHRPT